MIDMIRIDDTYKSNLYQAYAWQESEMIIVVRFWFPHIYRLDLRLES